MLQPIPNEVTSINIFLKRKTGQFDEKSNRTGIEHDGNQTISSGHFIFLSLLSRASWLPGIPNLAMNSPGEFAPTDLVPAQDMGRSEFLTWTESSFNPALSPWAGDNLTLPVSSLGIEPLTHVPALGPASVIFSLGIFGCSLNLPY